MMFCFKSILQINIWIILIGSRDTNDFLNPSICKHEFKFTCRGYCRFILKLVIVVAVIALMETMLYRKLLFNLIKMLLMFNISENSEQTKSCKSFLSGWCKCIRTLRTFIVIKLCRTPGMDFRICQKMTKADYSPVISNVDLGKVKLGILVQAGDR